MNKPHVFDFESECFEIGQCAYTASIEYSYTWEGELEVVSCSIEVASDDFTVWAKVDSEYFPAIERQLIKELKEAA